jgi:hypothetical protein
MPLLLHPQARTPPPYTLDKRLGGKYPLYHYIIKITLVYVANYPLSHSWLKKNVPKVISASVTV